jgi:iron complex outermembrane receptor protein
MWSRLGVILFILFAASCEAQCDRTIQLRQLDQLIFDSITVSAVNNPYFSKLYIFQSAELQITELCKDTYLLKSWLANTLLTETTVDLSDTSWVVAEFPISSLLLTPISILPSASASSSQQLYLRSVPAKQGYTLAKMMDALPGMSSLQSGAHIAKPMYYGFTGQRLVLFKNDLRLEGQQWGNDHGPEINPLYAARIEIEHGAEGTFLASDAVGAIARLTPPVIDDSLFWSVNWLQSFGSNGRQIMESLDLRHQPRSIPGLHLSALACFSRAGNSSTPSYVLANTGFIEKSIDLSAHFQRKKLELTIEHGQFNSHIGIFVGAHNGNLTDLLLQIQRNTPPTAKFSYQINRPKQDIYHENESIRIAYRCSDKMRLVGFLARQYDERREYDALHTRNDSIAALDRAALELHLTHYQGQGQAIWSLNDVYKIKISAGQHRLINTYAGRFYIPNYKRINWFGALLIQRKWRTQRIEATARFDHIDQTVYRNQYELIQTEHQTYHQPALGLSYFIDKSTQHHLEGHLTYNNRPPTVNERFANGLHHGLALYEMGEMNLSQEYAMRFLALYAYSAKKFNFSAQAMAQHIAHYIHVIPQAEPLLTIRGAFPAVQYAQSDSRFVGLNVRAEFIPHPNWSIVASSQVLRAHILPSQSTPANTPGDEYRMNILYRKVMSAKFTLSIDYHIAYYQKQWRISNALEIIPPPPSAFVNGLSINGERRCKNRILQFGITAENLTNTTYRLYTDRMRYFHDAIGRQVLLHFNLPLQFQK